MKKPVTALGIGVLSLSLAITMVATKSLPVLADEPAPTTTAQTTPLSCEEIVAGALGKLQDACNQLERNTACYGNSQVQADLQSDSSVSFLQPGDMVPIKLIKTITTSPLDQQTGTWGLSLLKLQANLPDTVPGQNVTFLVYGNTSIQNLDGAMQAFYFSTGLGASTCIQAPPSLILVRSPDHMQVTFTANGVNISIASTISLSAAPNQAMVVELLEGHATVTNTQGSQVLQPGQMTSIKLGGKTGLEPQSAPAMPVDTAPKPSTLPALASLDVVTKTKGTITIRGCVTRIENNTAMIGDYPIAITPDNPALTALRVGDCIVMSGPVKKGGPHGMRIEPDHLGKPGIPLPPKPPPPPPKSLKDEAPKPPKPPPPKPPKDEAPKPPKPPKDDKKK